MHDTADALGWVWGGVLTLGSAEDQVEHAICAFTNSSDFAQASHAQYSRYRGMGLGWVSHLGVC